MSIPFVAYMPNLILQICNKYYIIILVMKGGHIMKVGDRIKKRREEIGMSADKLGSLIGVSRSTIYRYESGDIEKLPTDILGPIAKALRVTPAYLMGWDEDDPSKLKWVDAEYIDISNYVKIPVVGSIPAGVAIEAIEDIVDYIDIPSEWVTAGKQFIGLSVKGDSMYPVLLDGDIVIIRIQPSAETGEICACYINGYDVTLKRIELNENSITLRPENTNYSPSTYTHPGEVTIVGKVVEVRRKL